MLNFLVRNGLRRGLLGDSRPWLVLGAAAWGLRFVKKSWGKELETVDREELRPGETLVISHLETTRKQLRRS